MFEQQRDALNHTKAILAIICVLALSACDAVDSDFSPFEPKIDPVGVGQLPEVEAFVPPTDRPYYNGPEERLTLSEDNWLQITWAVYQISSAMDRVADAYSPASPESPMYLSTQPDEPFFPAQCEAGSVTIREHAEDSQKVETYVYDRCVVGDREITALHLYSNPGPQQSSSTGIEVWIGDTLVETPTDEVTYSSRIAFGADYKYAISSRSFGLYSLRMDQTFVGEDLNLAIDGISGKLYVNDQGYLDIPVTSTSEAITLEGADGVALIIYFDDLQEGTIRLALMEGETELQTTEVDASILNIAPIPQ